MAHAGMHEPDEMHLSLVGLRRMVTGQGAVIDELRALLRDCEELLDQLWYETGSRGSGHEVTSLRERIRKALSP